ncbi:hypothetical protein [Dactylosporangium darangshiense]
MGLDERHRVALLVGEVGLEPVAQLGHVPGEHPARVGDGGRSAK